MKHRTDAGAPFTFVPRERIHLLDDYAEQLRSMNKALNLVARTSVDRIREDHIAHCLTLAAQPFFEGARVVDWGSGGGLPAIPLAICFPHVEVIAVDSIRKKADAVRLMARRLGLSNLSVANVRAESFDGTVDFAVSRATARLRTLWEWTQPVLARRSHEMEGARDAETPSTAWPRGLICLKGGEIDEEWQDLSEVDPSLIRSSISLETEYARPDWMGKYIVCVQERVVP